MLKPPVMSGKLRYPFTAHPVYLCGLIRYMMKTAVITGGSSGMGKAIATFLASKNFRVIIHGRDGGKTAAAAEEIRNRTGNPRVDFIVADVSTLQGMKLLADGVRGMAEEIHALVLSTGVILPDYHRTEDGLEKGFVIQYLSRFAVTQLWMPLLIKGNAKVVMVGASVLPGAKIYFDDLSLKNNFTMTRAMAQEMFANHLFVQEFATRHPDRSVVMNMANVGVVKTDIVRHSHPVFKWLLGLVGRSPESAAKNFVYLASDEAVNFSGYYLRWPGRHRWKSKIKYSDEIAAKLWDKSMELIRPIL